MKTGINPKRLYYVVHKTAFSHTFFWQLHTKLSIELLLSLTHELAALTISAKVQSPKTTTAW